MNYKSPVENSKITTAVIPIWFIIIFVSGIIFISYLLFPAKSLRYQVLKVKQPQLIAQYYLQKLVQIYPEEYLLKVALIQQEIGLHHWDVAEKYIENLEQNPNLAVETRLMRFLLAYTQAFQIPRSDPARNIALQKLSVDIPSFLHESLPQDQILLLASYALNLNMPGLALQFYQELGKMTNIDLLKQIAQTALQTSQYAISSQYYMQAMQNEKTLELKRNDVILALKALQAGGLFNQGIELATKLPANIIDNKAMLLFLTQYMLSANRPDLAQDYIERALPK